MGKRWWYPKKTESCESMTHTSHTEEGKKKSLRCSDVQMFRCSLPVLHFLNCIVSLSDFCFCSRQTASLSNRQRAEPLMEQQVFYTE